MNKNPYNQTILLPQTSFSMRAGLTEKEPKMLEHWQKIDLWKKLRKQSEDRPVFTLHDGPPYANGSIHLGTMLNKILKDTINRYQQMTGKNACYVPGWDCHGLPIEWIVEKQYREEKKPITRQALRLDCAKFAEHWMEVQKAEFKRLGVLADWDNAYHTMQKSLEGDIVKTVMDLLMLGAVEQCYQTVLWSPAEGTSLAESEVEYHTIESQSAYIAFGLPDTKNLHDNPVALLIWTTTPWTIVGNKALAVNPDHDYAIYEIKKLPADFKFKYVIIAKNQAQHIAEDLDIELMLIENININNYANCIHPLHESAYWDERPILPGDFVNLEQGTGIVHIAPGHGEDDFSLGKKYNLDLSSAVDARGHYMKYLPVVGGQYYEKGKKTIMELLSASQHLLGTKKITHNYPHSWRSKKPLIYRSTKQWFIDLHKTHIKQNARKALQDVNFIPRISKKRMTSMLTKRPDWLLSRQRHWGVPITILLHKETGEPLRDLGVNQKIHEIICREGSNAWFDYDISEFLTEEYRAEDYEKVEDILDIWFESGCTHIPLHNNALLSNNHEKSWPIDLCVEGTDQHRGWFQSSLLVACCRDSGSAPYKTLLTHGFVLDAQGRKMSKSLGNVIAPKDIIDKYGVEILRIWCVSSNYKKDIKISDVAINDSVNMYRRIRNTFRFIMGNLHHHQQDHMLSHAELLDFEKFTLYQLYELVQSIFRHNQSYNVHKIFHELYHFCDTTLSGQCFDIWKDTLYCDGIDDRRRRSACTVLQHLFDHLVRLWAPILPFTMEEAWRTQYPQEDSIHLQQLIKPETLPSEWQWVTARYEWQVLFDFKKSVQQAIEQAKEQGVINSQDDAKLLLYPFDKYHYWEYITAHLLIPQVKIFTPSLDPEDDEIHCYKHRELSAKCKFQIVPADGRKCSHCRLERIIDSDDELCKRCDRVANHAR